MRNSLQDWLDENNRSQSWLARQIGKSQSMVNKICRNQRTVNIRTAHKIREVTGLPIVWIDGVFIPKGRQRKRD